MNRRDFLGTATTGAAGILASSVAASAAGSEASRPREPEMPPRQRPKMLFFDVNETLLDLSTLRASVAKALNGRADLLPLWFTTMLQYSLVATVGDRYQDFGAIGAAALMMVARNQGISLSETAAREAIVGPIRTLPPHPDVAPALKRLRDAGYRMVTFTNSSQAGVDGQIKNAGLMEFFEDRLSVGTIELFKPHHHTYRWAANKMGVQPHECMLVAAHGWDIAGALWTGWRGAFLSRPGAQLYPLAAEPEIIEPDLRLAADRLIALKA